MTIEVLIKNLDTRLDTKEVVQVFLEHKSLVKTIHSLHKSLKPGEETKAYVHPGQAIVVREYYERSV